MGNYTTKYLFEFDVQGEEAVRKAQQMAQAINDAVNKTAAPKTAAITPEQILPAQTKTAFEEFATLMQDLEIKYFGLRRLSYGLQSTGRDLTQAGLMTIRAMTSVAQSYLTFNEAATRTAIAMQLPIKMENQLEEATMRLSETAGTFSATELMQGLRVWSQSTGSAIKTNEDLNKSLEATATISQLAAMSDADLATATDRVSGIMNGFQMGVSGVNDIVSVLNYQFVKNGATVDSLGASLKYMGAVASDQGTTFEELAVVFGDLNRAQIDNTMAGRAMKQMYVNLSKETPKVTEAMNALLHVNVRAGESWRDIIFPGGKFVGLYDYLDIIASATENLTGAEKDQYLAVLASANEMPALARMVDMTTEARKKGFSYYRAAWKEQQGIMDDEVLAYQQLRSEVDGIPYTIQSATGLWSQATTTWVESDQTKAKNLQNAWDNAMVEIGRVVMQEGMGTAEKFTDAMKGVAEFVEKNPWVAEFALKFSILEVAFGTATTGLGKFLQIMTNVIIMVASSPTIFAMLGTSIGAVTAALGPWAAAILAVVAAGKLLDKTVGGTPEEKGLTKFLGTGLADAFDAGGDAIKGYLDYVRKTDWPLAGLADKLWHVMTSGEAVTKMVTDQGMAYEKLDGVWVKSSDLLNQMGHAEEEEIRRRKEMLGLATPIPEGYVRPSLGGIDPATLKTFMEKWQPLVDRLLQYQNQVKTANRDFNQSMSDMARDFQRSMAEFDIDRTRSRAGIVTDYEKEVAKAAADLDKQLAKARDEFLKEELRASEDHDKRLTDLRSEYLLNDQRAHEDHVSNLMDLAAKQDARGMLSEIRSYKKERQRRELDYAIQVKGENDSYALQEKRRKEDYDLRVKEIRDSNAEQLAEARQGMLDRLAQFDEETALQRQSMIDRYNQQRADAIVEHDRTMKQMHDDAMEEIQAQLDALTLPQEDLDRLSLMRMEQLQEFLGKDIGLVTQWYGDALRQAAKDAWAQFWDEWHTQQTTATSATGGTGGGVGGPVPGEPTVPLPKPKKPAAPPHRQTVWEYFGLTLEEWNKLTYAQQSELIKKWPDTGVGSFATGGIVPTTGIYQLEAGERVVPLPGSHLPFGTMGTSQTTTGGQALLIRVEQHNWHFDGSMSAADRQWFRDASRDTAYQAITEVFRKR